VVAAGAQLVAVARMYVLHNIKCNTTAP